MPKALRDNLPLLFERLDKRCDGTQYSYNRDEIIRDFKNKTSKLNFYCNLHGSFISPFNCFVTRRTNCPYCNTSPNKNLLLTPSILIERLNKRCKDTKFSFIEEEIFKEYKNSNSKLKIYCSEHGLFRMNFDSFVNSGQGCSRCSGNIRYRDNIEELFNILTERCSNTLYSVSKDELKENYFNQDSKIKIHCSLHGIFYSSLTNFLNNKNGCPKCSNHEKIINKLESSIRLIEESCASFQYLFCDIELLKQELKNSKSRITISCKKHGKFNPTFNNFVFKKSGCPICKLSKGEEIVRKFLEVNNISFNTQKKFEDLGRKRFDFYIENFNLVLEFHGMLHYEFSKHFHRSIENFNNYKLRDKIKKEFCEKNGIKYIELDCRIYNTSEKIEEFLTNLLLKGTENEIYTLACT